MHASSARVMPVRRVAGVFMGARVPKADDDCLEPPRLCLYNLGALDGGVER